jgi:hypothetical protein
MNAYWKYNLKYSRALHLPALKAPVNTVKDLTSGFADSDKIIVGRSWKVHELRLKSDLDLHKLWYVLLKEKLGLKSDMYYIGTKNPGKVVALRNCLGKVQVSMSRLRSVVGERTTIRNEFMRFLEFWYIRKVQNLQADKSDRVVKEKSAEKEEVQTINIEPSAKTTPKPKKVVIRGALETTDSQSPTEPINVPISQEVITESNKVSVLTQGEIKILENLKKDYKSSKHLLSDFVQNKEFLKGREKRIAISMINSTRAKHAREIFLKEMAAISYKLKNTTQSKNTQINKLENLA